MKALKKRNQHSRTKRLLQLVLLGLVTGALPLQAMAAEPSEVAQKAADTSTEVQASATEEAKASESAAVPADTGADTHALGETVVTATRVAAPLSKVPANVTVITAKEIEKRSATSVRDILAREASVFVSPTADTKDGLMLRGHSSSDVLVLYNGQQVNAGFDGSLAWDSIPIDDIDRIEIVRGAGSSLYGGHAVAGVINIVTKTPPKDGELHGSVMTSYGTNNTWRRSLRVTGNEGKLSFRTGYEKRTTDGYPGYFAKGSVTTKATGTEAANTSLPRDAAGNYLVGSRGDKEKDNENITFGLRYDFSKDKYLDYSYTHADYRYDYNNPFTYLYDAAGNPIYNGYVKVDGKTIQAKYANYLGYHGERGQDMHALRYEDKKNAFKVELDYNDIYKEGYSSVSSSAPTSLDWEGAGERSSYPSKHYGIDLQKTWKLGNHTLLAGGAWMKDTMDYKNYHLSSWKDLSSVVGSPTVLSEGNLKSSALFFEDEYAFAPKWTLGAGLRYDRFDKADGYSSLLDSKTGSYKRKDYPDESFTAWSPKVALSYEPQKDMLLYMSFGKSFNPPSIFKLYRRASDAMSSVQPNPDLTPEVSDTYEIGFKQRLGSRLTWNADVFRIHTKDKIALGTQNGVKSYYNADSAFAKGFELGLNYRLTHDWQTYLNYTFESADLTTGGVTERDWDIPKHMLHMGLDWTKGRYNAGIDATYVSARQDVSATTGEYGAYDAYFLTNLYVNYKIEKNFKAQFTVNNLFDRDFYSGEAAYGRTYTFGLQLDF